MEWNEGIMNEKEYRLADPAFTASATAAFLDIDGGTDSPGL